MKDRIRLSLTWDGALPLTTALIPLLVSVIFPKNDGAALLTIFYLPMIAALLRIDVGYDQIKSVCGGKAPALRQCSLAVAIVLLFVLDLITTAWWLAPVDMPETVLPAVGIYAAYLLFVTLALMPSTATSKPSAGFQHRLPPAPKYPCST